MGDAAQKETVKLGEQGSQSAQLDTRTQVGSGHSVRRWLIRIYQQYSLHQCSLLASACAYCAMLSLIPLLIVAIAGLGYFPGGTSAATDYIVRAVRDYAPINRGFVEGLRSVLDHVAQDRRMLGVFGLCAMVWSGHQVYMAMEQSMNVIYGVNETRHWFRQRLVAIIAGVATPFVLVMSVVVVASFGRLEANFSIHLPSLVHIALTRTVSATVPTLIIWYLIAVLYHALPSCAVKFRHALLGAAAAAVLWHASLIGFGIYLRFSTGFDRLYGPLAGLVIIVVWCYYSMSILLLGAEITADLGKMSHLSKDSRSGSSQSLVQ